MSIRAIAILAGVAALSTALYADEPTPLQINKLIEQLVDPAPAVRKQATKQLTDIGAPALAPLREALKSKDADLKARATEVLERIAEAHIDPAVDFFKQTGKVTDPRLLPGYERWIKIVGEGKEQREAYAGILEEMLPILRLADTDPKKMRDDYRQYSMKLVGDDRMRLFEKGKELLNEKRAVAVLFMGSDPVLRAWYEHTQAVDQLFYRTERRDQVLQLPLAKQLLDETFAQVDLANPVQVGAAFNVAKNLDRDDQIKRHRAAVVKLLADKEIDKLPYEMHWLLSCARKLEVSREGLTAAVRIASDPKQPARWTRGEAVYLIGLWGDQSHVNLMQSLFGVKDQVTTFTLQMGGQAETRVGDIALAAAVHLTKQKMADYPFASFAPNPDAKYDQKSSMSFGFENDKQRQAAFDQWNAWAVKNLPAGKD